ncbi:MAG TPA: ABC transporter ATP-binding protein [Terriglobales bacterium]|nr:ABC transporter ATP-binding protein [Terriglobales bacterium]
MGAFAHGFGGPPLHGSGLNKTDKSWREMWPHVLALLRPRWLLLTLGLLLMLVNRVCGLVLPTSTKYLIDLVIDQRRLQLLLPILAIVLLATVLQGATTFALAQTLSKEAQRLINELRRRVQEHLARLPIGFYDSNNTGALVSRVMSDVEGVRNLVGTGLVEFLGSIVTALIALVVLLRINVAMALVGFAFVAIFSGTIRTAFAKIRPIFRERRLLNAQVTGRLTESIAGVRVVKGYRAEAREAAVFAQGVDKLLRNVFRTVNWTAGMDLSSKFVMGALGAIIWYMGAVRVLNHAITLGDLVMFNAYLAMLAAPMVQIVNIGTQLSEALAGLERTHELLQIPIEDADPRRTRPAPAIAGEIEFDGVSFAYPNGQESGPEVLHDISFTARPGTMTALVGPSGSGKSTIIGLAAAFYTPAAGIVRLDGQDLATLQLDDFRRRLGVVLQESFLFDGTIRDNILFSRPHASEAEFLAACRTARVDEFAEGFEHGYDTVVGERGVKLSGGQRQRLSIARAILADPAILILDEATSSLDSESEAMIQAGLQYLLAGRTTLVIAHRLSTIRAADQILVIEAGRIIERGTHAALLTARGRYFELYMRQQGLDQNRFLAPGEGAEDDAEATAKSAPRGGGGSEDEAALNQLLNS